jgi:hypothetical protein
MHVEGRELMRCGRGKGVVMQVKGRKEGTNGRMEGVIDGSDVRKNTRKSSLPVVLARSSSFPFGRSGVVVLVVFAFFDAGGRPGESAASDVLSRVELRCGEAFTACCRSLVAAVALGKE